MELDGQMSKKRKKKKGLRVPAWLRKTLNIASNLAVSVPTKHDTVPGTVVKVAALLNALSVIHIDGRADTMVRLAQERDLVLKTSEPFVSLFFNTTLHEAFDERRFVNDNGPNFQIIHAKHEEYGELYFLGNVGAGVSQPMPGFYHTENFDFAGALRRLWQQYDGRIQATVERTTMPFMVAQSSTFSGFNEIPNPLYGSMHEKMEKLVERQRRFKLDGVPRSYMFYGLSGTGKSSFAQLFAERLGERTLRIDAGAIASMSVGDCDFLLKSLEPDFLLIDDIDKTQMMSSIATLLSILQRFKTDYPKLTVVITANAVDHFDPGFFRPGRIDTWVEFEPPSAEERKTILRLYCENLKIATKDGDIDRLVAASEALTQDYVREIAYELRCDDVDHVLERIAQMRALLDKAGAKHPSGLGDFPPSPMSPFLPRRTSVQ